MSPITWVFKGGTCLKKCYFETYRFSEDLDFSLTSAAPYDEPALLSMLREIADLAHELSGIQFSSERTFVKPRRDKLGRSTFQGKVAYRGPLMVPSWPTILFDLTQHEPIQAAPSSRRVSHAYTDGLPDRAVVTYSLEELLAEKTRALFERTRPRDLYDVMQLRENHASNVDFGAARRIFGRKCEAKEFDPPTHSDLVTHVQNSEELRADWNQMLAHQLPALPPVDALLARLEAALDWLDAAPSEPAPLLPVPRRGDEEQVHPVYAQYWHVGVPVDLIRFAAANRLLVEFEYHGNMRRIEPYSLRLPKTGNLLLYGFELDAGRIKAFKIAEIGGLRVTEYSFVPRYMIELA